MAGYLTEISHSLNGGPPYGVGIPSSAETHTFNIDLVSAYGSQFPSITSDNKGLVLSTLAVGVKDESGQTKTQSYQIARDPHKMIILNPPVAALGNNTPIHGNETIKDFFTDANNNTLKAFMYQPFVRSSGSTGFEAGSLDTAQANNLFIPGKNCKIGLSLTYTKTGTDTPITRYVNMPVSGTGWSLVSSLVPTQDERGVIGGNLPAAEVMAGYIAAGDQRFEMEIFNSAIFGKRVSAVFPNEYKLTNIKQNTNVTLAVFAYLGEKISGISPTAPGTLVETWSYNPTSATAYSRTRLRADTANNVDINAYTIGPANEETLPDTGGIGWVGDYDSEITTDTTVRIVATANAFTEL